MYTNIEICESPNEGIAGRTHIKMSALKISSNDNDNNKNGINWVEQYVQNNIKSLIGAAYKVTFIDDDKTIPSGHGDIQYDEDGNVIFPESDTVGSIQNAYIDSLQVNGNIEKVLVTEGYLYEQSYPNFVQWLKDETHSGTVYGSIEINGKNKSKKIIYENGGTNADGTPKIGRKPKVFDFTALAILSDFVSPADESSQVIELNTKHKEDGKQTMANSKIDIDNSKESAIMNGSWNPDKGSLFRACKEASNAQACFNEMFLRHPASIQNIIESDVGYEHHEIRNNKMVVSKAGCQAAASRLAANDSNDEEAKAHLKKHYNELGLELPEFLGGDNKSKGEQNSMESNTIMELNQKIEDKTNEINTVANKNKELTAKNTELSEAVTNANKTCEELNAKISSLTKELNTCKTELDAKKKAEADAKAEKDKTEVNSYFKDEIPKNGFSDEEINSLKPFVEKVDFNGLKSAEAEICAKKFKEMISENKNKEAEINSKNAFITIPESKKKVIADKKIKFFD
ncbi:MAG TPA: hypothetical protein DD724_06415 [Lactobacillus acetotolerans]|nr:hypothetical protein [Lactobacillus acetotolerans]